MRVLATALWTTLYLTAAPALADVPKPRTPATNLTPIAIDELPEGCRTIAKQASAPLLQQALAARISLAGCLAGKAIAGLKLIDTEESVLELDDAVQPSVDMLEEVIAAGDPTQELLANSAKGDLYTTLRVRMLSTLPATDGTDASQALRDARRIVLEAQLEPWLEKSQIAYERVLAIGKANPKLMQNPVVRTAVRACEQRLAPAVASR